MSSVGSGKPTASPSSASATDQHCREIVMLTLGDYEHIRAHPTWFLLVAG